MTDHDHAGEFGDVVHCLARTVMDWGIDHEMNPTQTMIAVMAVVQAILTAELIDKKDLWDEREKVLKAVSKATVDELVRQIERRIQRGETH